MERLVLGRRPEAEAFVPTLMEMGFDYERALAALEHTNYQGIDEALGYLLSNPDPDPLRVDRIASIQPQVFVPAHENPTWWATTTTQQPTATQAARMQAERVMDYSPTQGNDAMQVEV
jgi:hypothetical protein